MNTDFLTPIHDDLEASLEMLMPGSIGNSILTHSKIGMSRVRRQMLRLGRKDAT